MKRFRRIITMWVACVALVYPMTAQAWPGEGLWEEAKSGFVEEYNDIKEDLGEILDFTEGALEVGWEAIYGAGCGVKNLATWDGTSCGTSVADSGKNFRSLIGGIDDCVANFDPTTLVGMAAETTSPDTQNSVGFAPSEVEKFVGQAGQAEALTPAMQQYLKSSRAADIVANLPGWQKVSRKIPGVKYVAAIISFTATCGSTLDFLNYGLNFGVGNGATIIKRDGVWMECQWECVPKLELNTADCNAQASRSIRFEEVAGYLGEGHDPDDVKCTGPTTVETTAPAPSTAGSPAGPLQPQSVPGGAISGTCAQLIRQVASSRSTAGFPGTMVSACLNTTDSGCYVVKAQVAAGHAVSSVAPTLQQRCFT